MWSITTPKHAPVTIAIITLILAIVTACTQPANQKTVHIGTQTILADWLTTPTQQNLGLQNTPILADNRGVVIIDTNPTLWAGTLTYPIVALWIHDNRVTTKTLIPPCPHNPPTPKTCPHYESPQDVDMVIEVNTTTGKHVNIGDTVRVE